MATTTIVILILCSLFVVNSGLKEYASEEKKCCEEYRKNNGKNIMNQCKNENKEIRKCAKCQDWEDLYYCPHTCNNCYGTKLREEDKYYWAEVQCCREDKSAGKKQKCKNSNPNRYCTGCQTWYDFHWCPHTCDDCDRSGRIYE